MSLQRLYDLDKTFADELDKLLHDAEYVDELGRLPERELVQLVNHLNNIITHLDHTEGLSRKCLHVLRKICGLRKVLPTTYELCEDVAPINQFPDAFGGFCDAYEGTLTVRVCIKRLRISATGDREKVKELFCKEAVVWKRLNHPNIVPFRGVTFDPLQLISEWMPSGELRHYVSGNQDINLVNLTLGIAEGLAYLHSCDVIHGDLKGSNIMVDASGNARIMDFGLATIARDSNSLVSACDDHGSTFRWTAPEILGTEPISKASDVFSFGMVMVEVFTGTVPFSGIRASEVVIRITEGKRPERPDHPGFTEALWKLTQRCWSQRAQGRPGTEEVIKVLKELSAKKVAKTLPTPPRESSTMTKGPSTTVSRKPSVGGGGGVTPHEVKPPWPESAPPPPPKDDAGGRSIHGAIQAVAGGLPSADGNGSSTNTSAAEVVDEHDLRDRPKKEEAREPKEKLEGNGGKQLEGEKKEKKVEKAPKEEKPQPTDIATAAPVRTEGIQSSSGGGADRRPASSNTESDRSRDQALKAPIVEVRHSQQQANKPTDNPPNLNRSTCQNQEQTADGVSPTSQLSVPTSSTESEVSSEPQEKKHGLWCRARSFTQSKSGG